MRKFIVTITSSILLALGAYVIMWYFTQNTYYAYVFSTGTFIFSIITYFLSFYFKIIK